MFVKCPFCHRHVLKWFYRRHETGHIERRPDGQMRDHISAPKPERYAGSLDGIPQHYLHPKCGVVTTMPGEEIDPHVSGESVDLFGSQLLLWLQRLRLHERITTWQATGEVLMEYSGRLRLNYLRDTYRINYREDSVGVLLTPPAAKWLGQKLQRQVAKPKTWCFSLQCDGRGLKYDFDIVEAANLATHVLIEIDSVRTVIPRNCLRAIKGTVVHYDVVGGRSVLNILRLFVPRVRGTDGE